MSKSNFFDYWSNDKEAENNMEISHQPFWEKVLHHYKEKDLSDKRVLDFGCNQGGYLRYIYSQRAFKYGVGVDLAKKSVEKANDNKGELPIEYFVCDDVTKLGKKFDIALSTSVLYLIEDLPLHAKQIYEVLEIGGVYYASYSDYNGNPNLPDMYNQINFYASVKMQIYSLDYIAKVFAEAGFKVQIIRMKPIDFITIDVNDEWHKRVSERMMFEYEQSYLFRFIKQ